LLQSDERDIVPFAELDRMMRNLGNSQFSYDVFRNAYQSDDDVKRYIKSFDTRKLELKPLRADDDLPMGKKKDPNAVSKMAKRAVDIGKI
jgi:hypothetical protein